jgi:polyphosphate glucokinase
VWRLSAYPAPDMSSTEDATIASTPTTSGAGAAPAAATAKAVPLNGVALGIDVGGTGTKAAMIDLATAELVTKRYREATPQPSEPEAVIEVVAAIVEQVLGEYGPVKDLPIGCGLPGPIKYGAMRMAANLDKGWVDFDATGVIGRKLGRPIHVINDADAAGMAELAYGEAKDRPGTNILLTIGTGIGSAVISEARLVPNTELGHLSLHDQAAETLVGGAARKRRKLSWKKWANEFNEYLAMLEFYFWPDRIILGGGVSKESKRYWEYLKTNCDLVKARYLNTSGIIGAAYAAGLAVHEESVTTTPAPSRRSIGGTTARKRG